MPKSPKLKIVIVQISSAVQGPMATYQKVAKLLKQLSPTQQKSLIILPEMWPGRYLAGDKQQVEAFSIVRKKMNALALQMSAIIVDPSLENTQGHFYNALRIINEQGKTAAKYRKIHLFKYQGEHQKFTAGQNVLVKNIRGVKIGFAICYDLRFPEQFRVMINKGMQVLVIPAAWPQSRLEHFHALLQARAIENQIYVLGINKASGINDVEQCGGQSVLFGPWGEKLLSMGTKDELKYAELDLAKLAAVRKAFPALNDRVAIHE